MKVKPRIVQTHTLASSRMFELEAVDLHFANGQQAQYERVVSRLAGAVCVVAVNQAREVLLIREYCVGTDRYELALPKGKVEPGEQPEAAALREIQEEIGFAAGRIEHLKRVSIAPSYLGHQTELFLATELYPQRAQGDEPEPIEVVAWSLDELPALFAHPEMSEARSMVALQLALWALPAARD